MHALHKYQDGVGSLAGRCFHCFCHDVAAQEVAARQRERMVEGLAAKVRLLRKSGVVNEVIQDHGCYVV